jgi:hypothetical protein
MNVVRQSFCIPASSESVLSAMAKGVMFCTPHSMLFRWSNERSLAERGM